MHFFIFYDHLFKTSYGRKTGKNAVFGIFGVFSRFDISETVDRTEKVIQTIINQFFAQFSFLASEKGYDEENMLFLSTCLFLKNPDLRGNGAETQKTFFFSEFGISSPTRQKWNLSYYKKCQMDISISLSIYFQSYRW